VRCKILEKGCFDGIDLAFFDASDAISKEWVPEATKAGAWVIDSSATFRMEHDVPLVVPEINGDETLSVSRTGDRARIIAGPNCSTVQLVLALKPLHRTWGLKRVVVSTYQSVSGAGSEAVSELREQTRSVLDGANPEPRILNHRIAFNCIPHIGGFKDGGYTSEELKVIQESRKILGIPGLRITATAVRVPTLAGHAECVNVEFERPFDLDEVRAALTRQAGVRVLDQPENGIYPLNETSPGDAVEAAAGRDATYVGRLRVDHSQTNALHFWVVSDNLRKGAALNALQIGEWLLKRGIFGTLPT
ncbi:MAG: aspartate-semialdehyde dehydrogenase, partial [Bdellovibrionota bacterium]